MNNFSYCSFVSIHYIICECGDTFSTEKLLNEHIENEHKNPNVPKYEYQCITCGKIFATEKACIIHQQVHKRSVQREPNIHAQSKKKYYTSKNIVCEVCGKRYASQAALRYHQRVHTGERPYHCTMCPKTFTMPLFLQIHVRTHTGERPYECQSCPKAFSNKAALLRHDRVMKAIPSGARAAEDPDARQGGREIKVEAQGEGEGEEYQIYEEEQSVAYDESGVKVEITEVPMYNEDDLEDSEIVYEEVYQMED